MKIKHSFYFFLRYTVIAAVLLYFAGCSTVLLTGRKQFTAIPSSQIISLSQTSYKEALAKSKLSSNQAYTQQVRRVGKKVTAAVQKYMRENNLSANLKGYKWEYNVIESKEINAWCMPGGKIAFYEGIMPICADDEGVAVVMAHEIAHAVANHGNERLSQQLAVQMGGLALSEALRTQKESTQQLALAAFGLGSQIGVLLPYSRKHETEADELGLYFMALAGYNPEASPEFWKRMMKKGTSGAPGFLSTHPDPEERMEGIQKAMPKAKAFYSQNDN